MKNLFPRVKKRSAKRRSLFSAVPLYSPPRVWAGLTSSLPVASWDFWAVGREARLQGEEMVSASPDNFLASPGSHGECHQRACSKGLCPPGEGGTSHSLHPLCLHTMSSSGFRAKECIQHSTPSPRHCLAHSMHSFNI